MQTVARARCLSICVYKYISHIDNCIPSHGPMGSLKQVKAQTVLFHSSLKHKVLPKTQGAAELLTCWLKGDFCL